MQTTFVFLENLGTIVATTERKPRTKRSFSQSVLCRIDDFKRRMSASSLCLSLLVLVVVLVLVLVLVLVVDCIRFPNASYLGSITGGKYLTTAVDV